MRVTPNIAKRCLRAVSPSMSSSRTPRPTTARTGKPVLAAVSRGSSGASLHAKTFVVDGKRVFIGSLNFDPRSARLNTEMGMVIDHAEIAGDMRQELEKITPQYAYKVVMDKQRKRLRWQDPDRPDVLLKNEPDAGIWKRIISNIFRYCRLKNCCKDEAYKGRLKVCRFQTAFKLGADARHQSCRTAMRSMQIGMNRFYVVKKIE